MRIVIDRKDRECKADHCPAVGHIEGLPGYRLTIGTPAAYLLDAEGLADLAQHVGPGEFAVLTPEDL